MTTSPEHPDAPPAIELPPGWRPLGEADLPALAALEAASDVADAERFPTTIGDLTSQLLTPGLALERMSVGIEDEAGGLIGWCALEPRIGGQTWNRVHVHGSVHPAVRGRGHGRALLAWADGASLTHLRQATNTRPELPDVVTVHAASPAVSRARLQERCGYALVRWYTDMFRDLAQPIGDDELPPGYDFVPWSPERDEAFHAVDVAAFTGAWGGAPWTIEHWRHEFTDDEGFRPDLCVGVESAGELVAYVVVASYEGLEDDAGRRVAWLPRLGVRPEHRGQGLASAAISRVMRLAREAGFATAGLDVDTENVTGALRVYERLGFVPIKRLALRAKTVRAAGAAWAGGPDRVGWPADQDGGA